MYNLHQPYLTYKDDTEFESSIFLYEHAQMKNMSHRDRRTKDVKPAETLNELTPDYVHKVIAEVRKNMETGKDDPNTPHIDENDNIAIYVLHNWAERRKTRGLSDAQFDPMQHLLNNFADAYCRAAAYIRARPGTEVFLFTTRQGDVFFDTHYRRWKYDAQIKDHPSIKLINFQISSDMNSIAVKVVTEHAMRHLNSMNLKMIDRDSDGILYDLRIGEVLESAEEILNAADRMIKSHEDDIEADIHKADKS